ncbi:MAG: tyrosine-type recombinase/integrase [Caldilineaceae bacterium]|nr:tyrosine-type recombinase/integrase [Caldilineaceae bacterium]
MTTAIITHTDNAAIIPADTTDARLIEMWMHGRTENTAKQYARIVARFFETVSKPLQTISLSDLQTWADTLTGTAHTVKAHIDTVRSLFSFALKTGYIRLNPAAVLKSPATPDKVKGKVLSERETIAIINAAQGDREIALLQCLYSAGGRVSEICALSWSDVVPTPDGGAELLIFGKGGKNRNAKISADTHKLLIAQRRFAEDGAPVFTTRTGNPLDRVAVHRIVKAAAVKAGIKKAVSAHWFRHSHASHALERGANPAAVQEQLGHSSLATTTRYAHASNSSADYLIV